VISGDYAAATNNIYSQVSEAVSKVIAESPYLLPEEADAVRKSFQANCLHWVSRSGVARPILRGSMMGNLVGFCILCLINKACYNLACNLRRKRTGKLRLETAIINGDDIAFAGDSLFYADWRLVTATFGLVVNEEKTGFSDEFVELNSKSIRTDRLRPLRKPVLSCLDFESDDPSCLLTQIIDGLRTLSAGTLNRVIYSARNSIIRRGVCLSTVPRRFVRALLKKRWFRLALRVEPVVKESGVARHWPVVSRDFRPADSHMALYNQKVVELQEYGVTLARGLKCVPWSRKISGRPEIPKGPDFRLRIGSPTWKWRWKVPLLRAWEALHLPVRYLGSDLWEDDFPDLAVDVKVEIVPRRFPPPPSWLVEQGVDVSGHVFGA